MKTVTFVDPVSRLDDIENTSFEMTQNTVQTSKLLLTSIRDFFDEHKLAYRHYEEGQEQTDYAYVGACDTSAREASLVAQSFYRPVIVEQLLSKASLSHFLSQYGFDALRTKVVRTPADIDGENFFLKPIYGIGMTHMATKDQPQPYFSYKRYRNKQDLLAGHSQEELQAGLDLGYIMQEAHVGDLQTYFGIVGSTNKDADIYFARSNLNRRYIDYHLGTIRSFFHKDWEHLKPLFRSLVKQLNITNSVFNLQFLIVGNKMCPIDWNFRAPEHWAALAINTRKDEWLKFMMHLFDIPNDLPETYADVWFNPDLYRRKGRSGYGQVIISNPKHS